MFNSDFESLFNNFDKNQEYKYTIEFLDDIDLRVTKDEIKLQDDSDKTKLTTLNDHVAPNPYNSNRPKNNNNQNLNNRKNSFDTFFSRLNQRSETICNENSKGRITV